MAAPGPRAPSTPCGERGCVFRRLEFHFLKVYNVADIYACQACGRYHICDGGGECPPVNMGDTIVCELTGAALDGNFQQAFIPSCSLENSFRDNEENFAYMNIVCSLKSDIVKYFVSTSALDSVAEEILENEGKLYPRIESLIDSTLPLCRHILEEINCGYDIICSMYIHIIISIYSNRTIYDALLFKCTKNKKLDVVLKRVREAWMSTMLTREPSGRGAP